jgi:hypothetical protein
MSQRRKDGATLAIIAACTIIIVMVALGAYFLAQLLGGSRELQHVTDSGTLNVAKQALVSPNITLNNPNNDADIADMNVALDGVLDTRNNSNVANLLSFDRLVGTALIVCANAEADGSATAKANARKFVDLIEGDNGNAGKPSIGQQLRTSLINPTTNNNWAREDFNATAHTGLKMFAQNQAVWQQGDFKALYINDNQMSNVTVTDFNNNPPFTNFTTVPASFDPAALTSYSLPAGSHVNSNGQQLIKGYTPIRFNGVSRDLYAVSLDANPHLVSKVTNNTANSTGPGENDVLKKMWVPPNAFLNASFGLDQVSKHNVRAQGIGMVGTSRQPYTASLPRGYIVIDNAAGNPVFNGLLPNAHNVFANELGRGIRVNKHRGYFDNEGRVRDWEQQKRVGPDGSPDSWLSSMGPSAQGITSPDGRILGADNASKAEADRNIPYDKDGDNSVTCTDQNSDPPAAPSGSGEQACIDNTTPGRAPNGQDWFNYRYWRNDNGQDFNNGTSVSMPHVTNGQQFCLQVLNNWVIATRAQLGTGAPVSYPYYCNLTFQNPSGQRLYPLVTLPNGQKGARPQNGVQTPWAPTTGSSFNQGGANNYSNSEPCDVQEDGTIAQLVDQSAILRYDTSAVPVALSNQAKTVEKLIKQRMNEILRNGSAQYNSVVATKKLPPGTVWYIYLTNPTTFTMSQTAPTWFSKTPTFPNHALSPVFTTASLNTATTPVVVSNARGADGTPRKVCAFDYGASQTLADAHNQGGIHDHPFIFIYGADGTQFDQTASSNVSTTANGTAQVHDSVVLSNNSGTFGNELSLQFLETTTGGASLMGRD